MGVGVGVFLKGVSRFLYKVKGLILVKVGVGQYCEKVKTHQKVKRVIESLTDHDPQKVIFKKLHQYPDKCT